MEEPLKLVNTIRFDRKGDRYGWGILCFLLGHKWVSTHWVQDDTVGFSCDRCGKEK